MRPDYLYLHDIVDACDAVTRFLADYDAQSYFLVDDLRQSAVLQKFIVIGEAASRISKDARDGATDIPWSDIIGFRNIAVHAYFSVDWAIVWVTATRDIPQLRTQIQMLIDGFANADSSDINESAG